MCEQLIKCRKCGEEKPVGMFYPYDLRHNRHRCKPCKRKSNAITKFRQRQTPSGRIKAVRATMAATRKKYALLLQSAVRKYAPWTTYENSALLDETKSASELARILGRTLFAIHSQRRRLAARFGLKSIPGSSLKPRQKWGGANLATN